jgi:hypothetical protein
LQKKKKKKKFQGVKTFLEKPKTFHLANNTDQKNEETENINGSMH